MRIVTTITEITKHPLNRSSRIGAISRFVRWQIASRLIQSPIALPFVGGTRLLTARGMTSATGNWYCGLFEPEEMAFVLHALRPGDLFVDVGANIGGYSIMAAGAAGADVLAIEPVSATFGSLQDNIRLNRLEKTIEARCCGVSDAPGNLRFTTDHGCQNRVDKGDGGSTAFVIVDTLDNICPRVPAIIKIDVEGHETAVLKGGSRLLTSPELQAVVMENGPDGRADMIIAAGFIPCIYDWRTRTLSPANVDGLDTIYARHPEALTERCRVAPRFNLVNGTV